MILLDRRRQSRVRARTIMATLNPVRISISTTLTLEPNTVPIKVKHDRAASTSKLKIFIKPSNRNKPIGTRNTPNSNRTNKTLKNRRKKIKLTRTETHRRKKNGMEDIRKRKRSFIKNTFMETRMPTRKSIQEGQLQIPTMIFMTKNQFLMSLSMPSGSPSKRRFIKSMSQRMIQTFIRQIEDSMQGQICFLGITSVPELINGITTPLQSETTKHGIQTLNTVRLRVPCSSSFSIANFINNQKKLKRA